MCGIAGYLGKQNSLDILLDSLQRVTYRGYDSFGVAVRNGRGIVAYKALGTVEEGRAAISELRGHAGIGHTRWATVGEVNEQNAHPHLDCSGRIAIVHNGDIENYLELKAQLQEAGHVFSSDTDSEVIAHLIESHRRSGLLGAVRRAVKDLEGCYAMVVLDESSGEIIAARNESPLVVAIGDGEVFAASDVPAVLPYTNKIVYLEDGDVARLRPDSVQVWSNGHQAKRGVHIIDWSVDQLDRAGFRHYMLKEIHEQPEAFRETLAPHLNEGPRVQGKAEAGSIDGRDEVLLIGCGTSYHAGLIGKQVMERLLPLRVDVQVATELHCGSAETGNSLAITLSQSGETADTISALQRVKAAGYQTLAVTNVMGSSITRRADATLYTHAGPEVAVAATKTFLSQLAAIYALACSSAAIPEDRRASLHHELRSLPHQLAAMLSDVTPFEQAGRDLGRYDNLFLIARGLNYPVALEGALKFKEVAYVHAEGTPAGELKHGPFALLGPDVPIIAIVAPDEHQTRMHTAIREIRARGSRVIAIAPESDRETEAFASEVLRIPDIDPLFAPVLNTVACQLLSYYCALERGCEIDRPRNLAKSVTVP